MGRAHSDARRHLVETCKKFPLGVVSIRADELRAIGFKADDVNAMFESLCPGRDLSVDL